MHSVHRIGAGAALALLAVPAVLAQHADLEEIVVTATPLQSSPLLLAQSAVVLKGDDLTRNIAASIGESLASQPGITGSYFGPKSSRPVIRGLGGERVLMLVNGVSALDVSNLSPDHSVAVEPLLADQIEVLKGPTTLLFGSGAVGGVVNTVDGRIPTRRDGEPIEGAAEARADSATGEQTFVGRLDGLQGTFGWHVDAYSRETDDISIPGRDWSDRLIAEEEAEGEPIEATRGEVPNSDSDSSGYTAGFSWLGENAIVGFAYGRAETNYGLPGPAEHAHEDANHDDHSASAKLRERVLARGLGAPSAAAADEEAEELIRIDQQSDRYDFKAQWDTQAGLLESVLLRAAYNDYEHVELEGAEVGTRFEQTGIDTRLHANHRAIAGWSGTLGMQYTTTDLEAVGAEAYVPPSDTRALSAFLVEQRPFGDWVIDFGARVEQQEIDVSSAAPDYDGTAYSLAAGAVWQWTEGTALAAHVTRSERHPQAAELYADGPHLAVRRYEIGDAGLDTEIANTIDLGLRRTGEVSWRASVFYSRFDDYIYQIATGTEEDGLPVYVYAQADAEFHGIEAEVDFPLFDSEQRHVHARLGADYVRGELTRGEDLPQMPPLRLTARIEYDTGPWHSSLGAAWYDDQSDVAPGELPTDGYTLVDFDASYRWERWRPGVLLFLRASNLLDEEARRHTSALKDYVPLPGRSVMVGIRIGR